MRRRNKPVNRREFIKQSAALGGSVILGGASQEGAQSLNEGIGNIDISMLLDSPESQGKYSKLYEAQIAKHMEKVKPAYTSFLKNAQKPFDYTRKSRLDYASTEIHNSDLPEELKEMMIFGGFEESLGFTSRAHSPAGADGPWQFMPKTGRRYGLKNRADRRDMRKSTDAAIRYYQDSFDIFKKNTNWQKIKSNLSLDDDELIPFVISAFNAGKGHIKYVLDLIANDNKEQKIATKYAKTGKFGLFTYMMYEYKPRYKELQKAKAQKKGYNFTGEYYHKQSSEYVYKIMGFHHIHHNLSPNTSKKEIQMATKVESSDFSTVGSSLIGAGSSAIAYATIKNRKRVKKSLQTEKGANKLKSILKVVSTPHRMSRRNFLKSLGAIGAAGAVGGILNEKTNIVGDTLNTGWEFVKEEGKEILRARITASFDSDSIESKKVFSTAQKIKKFPSKEVPTIESNKIHYPYNQYMADTAFSLYKSEDNREKADKYLSMALYFYQKALDIAKGQKSKKISPRPNENKINERINYCRNALAVISAE